jgi:S1-C subfamily serine protease
LGLSCLLALNVPPASAQNDDGQKIYQRTLKSVVWIVAKKGDRGAMGTGSLIDKTHHRVITNYHVVNDAQRLVVVFADFTRGKPISERNYYWEKLRKGGSIGAKVVEVDPKRDLAVIQLDRVPADAQPVRLSRDGVGVGQTVHSIGNPGKSDFNWEYTSGTVRQLGHKKWRAMEGTKVLNFEAKVIETQSPTNAGDSGGPLVNGQGELVGITQGMATDAQLLSIFVDVSEVKSFLASKRLLPDISQAVVRGDTEETSRSSTESKGQAEDTAALAEHKASTKLKFAKTLAEDGKLEKAKDRCEEIISTYPNTKAAAEAKQLLEKLSK